MVNKRATLGDRPKGLLFKSTPIVPPELAAQIGAPFPAPLTLPNADEPPGSKASLIPDSKMPIDKCNFHITHDQNEWLNLVCQQYSITNRSVLMRHIIDTYRHWLEQSPSE